MHQPSEVGSFSYWFDKPWFHTEGRLAAVLIIPSSWGSQLGGHLHDIKQFFWRRCWGLKKKKIPRQPRTNNFSGAVAGEKEDFCKGSLSLPIFFTLLLFCLILFLLASFYQKYKKLVPL
jgi:hypothetical protein